jgi:hypothetical protein
MTSIKKNKQATSSDKKAKHSSKESCDKIIIDLDKTLKLKLAGHKPG